MPRHARVSVKDYSYANALGLIQEIEPGDYITYLNMGLGHYDGHVYRVLTVGAVLNLVDIMTNQSTWVHITRVNGHVRSKDLYDPNFDPDMDSQVLIERILQIEIEK